MIPWSEKRHAAAEARGWKFAEETEHPELKKPARPAEWGGTDVAHVYSYILKADDGSWYVTKECALLFDASDQELRIRGLEFAMRTMQHAVATIIGAARQAPPESRIIMPNGGR